MRFLFLVYAHIVNKTAVFHQQIGSRKLASQATFKFHALLLPYLR